MTEQYQQQCINRLCAGGGGGGGGNWFQDAIWIDGGTTVDPGDQDGTMGAPYSTFAAAIAAAEAVQDALPIGILPTERAGTRQVFVVAGGIYDEPIEMLRGNTFYIFLVEGPVTLGNGLGSNFSSTNTRDVIWVNDAAIEDADAGGPGLGHRRPQLVIATMYDAGPMSSTHTAVASGMTISGDLVLQNPGGAAGGTTAELHLSHVKVVGDLTRDNGTDPDFGIRNCYLNRCFFDSDFNIERQGGNGGGNLVWVRDTEFDGLITVDSYSRIVECEIQGGMTTVTGVVPLLPPTGFFNTDFSGTFTGPAGSVALDAASNFFFKANGAALAGGATKVIIGDLVP